MGKNHSIILFSVDYVFKEDAHKKSVFFSGTTTKGVGRVNPTDHYAKTHFFSLKSGCFSQKIGTKRKNRQNPFHAIIRLIKRKKCDMDR